MDTELYKNRSISGCIKAALFFLISQSSRILKFLWLPVLSCSIATATLLYCIGEALTTIPQTKTLLIYISGLFLLALVTAIWFQTSLLTLSNGFCRRANCKKSMIILLFHFVFILLAVAIILYAPGVIRSLANFIVDKEIIRTAISSVVYFYLFIILLLFYISWVQPLYRYIQGKEETFFTICRRYYTSAFRQIGFWIGVFCLMGLVFLVVQSLIAMPLTILIMAKLQSFNGELMGDPSGLPPHFGIMVWTVLVLVVFISLFFLVWLHFVGYYAYGAIMTRMEGRKKIKEMYGKTKNTLY